MINADWTNDNTLDFKGVILNVSKAWTTPISNVLTCKQTGLKVKMVYVSGSHIIYSGTSQLDQNWQKIT